MRRVCYCLCGASITVSDIDPDRGQCPGWILGEWPFNHHGAGHGETDARTCGRARRKAARSSREPHEVVT